jgi:hypothetical protein
MNKELFPILLALFILILLFGGWYTAKEKGWFTKKSANDIEVCRIGNDTLSLRWKDPKYVITGWNMTQHNEKVLHIEVNITRGFGDRATFTIDTTTVNWLELYGKYYKLEDIPICE